MLPARAPSALILLLALAVTGCEALSYKPKAVGREGEITVVTDSLTWEGPVGDALRGELASYIQTLPAPEPLFTLRRTSLASARTLDFVQRQKNVIFAAPITDTTREARYLRTRLDSAAVGAVLSNGNVAVIGRRDLWADQQQVYYIIAGSGSDAAAAIRENGENMRYVFNEITRERMGVTMFEKGRQPELEQRLLDRHNFAVNAQHDYLVAMDTTNFVWLRRIVSSDSWRSLFVWYTDEMSPVDLTPEWILSTRDRLTSAYVQGNLGGWVEVDRRRPIEDDNINFLDRFGYEVRGLWHMVGPDGEGGLAQYGMGGPFVTYGFYDELTGRTYIVDGMVFAPGFEKREFLRQMEVIAHTFRTREEGEETELAVSNPPSDSPAELPSVDQ